MPKMTNCDLGRILKSDEIRAVIRKPMKKPGKRIQKKNPLKNVQAMLQLNPYAAVLKRASFLQAEANIKKKNVSVLICFSIIVTYSPNVEKADLSFSFLCYGCRISYFSNCYVTTE